MLRSEQIWMRLGAGTVWSNKFGHFSGKGATTRTLYRGARTDRQTRLKTLSSRNFVKKDAIKLNNDFRNNGRVFYRETTDPDILARATVDVRTYLAPTRSNRTFTATSAFIVTWFRLTHYTLRREVGYPVSIAHRHTLYILPHRVCIFDYFVK